MKKFAFILAVMALGTFMSCGGKDVKITPKDKGDVAKNVIPNKESNNSLPSENKILPDTAKKEVVEVVADTTKKVVNDNSKGTEKVMEDGENGKVKEVSKSDLKKNSKKKFYVIAGSYHEAKWATNVSKFYKSKGIPTSIMKKSNGYIRVSLGNYEYRVSAENRLKKLRKKGLKFKGEKLKYWLLYK